MENKIICPHCGTEVDVENDLYAAIERQVRDKAFMEELKARDEAFESEKNSAIAAAVNSAKLKLNYVIEEKNTEIARLKAQAEASRRNAELETDKRVRELEAEHQVELKKREEEISFYKDLKARQSTKMVGETLEQHCSIEFNRIRAAAFPNAYFEKDNEVSKTGSKGDFIFRDFEDGVEYISIMFEMKNQNETTAQKHKNEDFFKELDKDRKEKNCEYAVLVSMLESDSDLYNEGIVDVSYKYPKMYVVRPQFFIPLISLLRNASKNAVILKKQLVAIQNQDVDIANMEAELADFKNGFMLNVDRAASKFQTAIEEIDKTIDHLQKTKEALLSSDKNLKIAGNKVDGISVKKLAENSPTLLAKLKK